MGTYTYYVPYQHTIKKGANMPSQLDQITDIDGFIIKCLEYSAKNELMGEFNIYDLVIAFTDDYKSVAIADARTSEIRVYGKKPGSNKFNQMYVYRDTEQLVPVSMSFDKTGGLLAVGYMSTSSQMPGMCIVYEITSSYMTLSTSVIPDRKDLTTFGLRVKLSPDGRLLVVSAPHYKGEHSKTNEGMVFLHALQTDKSYRLVAAVGSQDEEITSFGLDICLNLADRTLGVLGLKEVVAWDQTETVLTVTEIKVSEDLEHLESHEIVTNIILEGSKRYRLRKFGNNYYALLGLPSVRDDEAEDAITIADVNHIFDQKSYDTVILSDEVNKAELVDLVQQAKSEVEEPAHTAVIESSKDPEVQKTFLRHHLVVQQLLNNIAIAIKEGRAEQFSIGGIEITEERIKITKLIYGGSKGQ